MIRRPPRSTLTHSFPSRRSSDLRDRRIAVAMYLTFLDIIQLDKITSSEISRIQGAASAHLRPADPAGRLLASPLPRRRPAYRRGHPFRLLRSEEHTSELQSLMRISYAVFCLKKKKYNTNTTK